MSLLPIFMLKHLNISEQSSGLFFTFLKCSCPLIVRSAVLIKQLLVVLNSINSHRRSQKVIIFLCIAFDVLCSFCSKFKKYDKGSMCITVFHKNDDYMTWTLKQCCFFSQKRWLVLRLPHAFKGTNSLNVNVTTL